MLHTNARYDEAQSVAEQAEAEGQLAGDRVAVAWALFAASHLKEFHHVDHAAALSLRERAAAVLGDDPEAIDLRIMLLNNRATALWNLGRRTEANRLLGQALPLAERAGTPQRLAFLRIAAADFGFLDGRWDDALVESEAAADSPTPALEVRRRGLAGLIAVHRDDQKAMDAHLGSGDIAGLPPGTMIMADKLVVARARAAERDGRPEAGPDDPA